MRGIDRQLNRTDLIIIGDGHMSICCVIISNCICIKLLVINFAVIEQKK